MKAELPNQNKRNFLKDCHAIIVALLQKVQERCPLEYRIVGYAVSMSPSQLIALREKSSDYFCKLVDKLYGGHWISSKAADLAKKEFDSLLKSAHTELKDNFLKFDEKRESFFAGIRSKCASYKNCGEIFKLVFPMARPFVERSFSINKELLVKNLHEESIVYQRVVYDHVDNTRESITKIPITNAMLKSCKLAHSRYVTALKEKKEISDGEMKNKAKIRNG